MRPLVAGTTVSAPRSQHSCFAALAKNSHLRTVFTALRAAASRRSVPTVTTFPRNDKLYGRARRFIRIIRIKSYVHPYHVVIASEGTAEAWQSPGRGTSATNPHGLRAPRWLTAEIFPALETITSVHVMRRDEGVPPYRRLRRESVMLSLRAKSRNPIH